MNKSAHKIEAELDEAIRKLAGSKVYELTGPSEDISGFWPAITYEGKSVSSMLPKLEKQGSAYIKQEFPNTKVITPCYLGFVPDGNFFVVGYNATYSANNFIDHEHQKGTIVTFNAGGQPQSSSRSMSEGKFFDTFYKKDLRKRYPQISDLHLY